ncbi:hypothetical protein GQ53DRAFT_744814 [Thozetella sp. PMI_491]|nr:hypothetical protein GQ53DRAFT_744814 [Thozetella sp. PMI_491]
MPMDQRNGLPAQNIHLVLGMQEPDLVPRVCYNAAQPASEEALGLLDCHVSQQPSGWRAPRLEIEWDQDAAGRLIREKTAGPSIAASTWSKMMPFFNPGRQTTPRPRQPSLCASTFETVARSQVMPSDRLEWTSRSLVDLLLRTPIARSF